MIIVSHDAEYVRDHCDHAAVIVSGKVTNFGNTSDAYSYYHESIK
jgi:capsular polysaccharide transport system ATP-binding protein